MTHLTDEQLEGLFRGGLGTAGEREAFRHLEACPTCSLRSEEVWEAIRPVRNGTVDDNLAPEDEPPSALLEKTVLRQIHRASLVRHTAKFLGVGLLTVAGALLTLLAIGAHKEKADDD